MVTQAQQGKQSELTSCDCAFMLVSGPLFWLGMHFCLCCCIFKLISTSWVSVLSRACTVLLLLMLMLARLSEI